MPSYLKNIKSPTFRKKVKRSGYYRNPDKIIYTVSIFNNGILDMFETENLNVAMQMVANFGSNLEYRDSSVFRTDINVSRNLFIGIKSSDGYLKTLLKLDRDGQWIHIRIPSNHWFFK